MLELTAEELKQFDGRDLTKPVYLAIKGTIFDVSSARESYYNEGKGYSCFAGKDASNALGKSSTNPDDCFADYSGLDSEQMQVLDKWYTFYEKKYPIVGKVVS